MSNQELINSQVCDLTMTHIKQVTAQTDVELIWFVLIVLLLSFFMRSIMLVLGIMSAIIVYLLFAMKRFTIKKQNIEGEVLEL